MTLDLNSDFQSILSDLEQGSDHLFITGRAGTGKSTLLQHFRANTKKKMVVLAPTGVAALNVQGQTIHSFFGFSPQVTPEQAAKEHPQESLQKLIQELEMIVIDEASMLRSDLLDSIDEALRQYGQALLPFGGKRMVFIGDLYQLPPVVTREEKEHFQQVYASPYFFDAQVFRNCPLQRKELQKIYRQQDQQFIELLNKIRSNQLAVEDLNYLNNRVDPQYQAYQKHQEITLCTTNAIAEHINHDQLERLEGKVLNFRGKVDGDFMRQLPTQEQLLLKIGAQVMLITNDPYKRWVNGSTGKIIGTEWSDELEEDQLIIKLSSGKVIEVSPFTWENHQYRYDEGQEQIQSEAIGSFRQYPLKLAWAVTIHKSQGKTFENVVLDIGKGTFSHGQIYVALSRCTSLDGLVLRQPIHPQHIWTDSRIQYFLGPEKTHTVNLTTPEKKSLLEKCIDYEGSLLMTYTTSTGNTFEKHIRPVWVGEMEYEGREYLALEAQDMNTGEHRAYSLKRIVKLEDLPENYERTLAM